MRSSDQAINNMISITAAGGVDPSGIPLAAFYLQVAPNGPLDVKNNFRGQGNAGFLGRAGNFAFGALASGLFGSGSFGQYLAFYSTHL